LVNQSGETLAEIVSRVRQVNEVMAEIANSSREQASGIEQVNGVLLSMETMTQQNAAQVENAATAAQTLNEQASDLLKLIGHYKVS
jgi:methyl-accepting chemotaxis protein